MNVTPNLPQTRSFKYPKPGPYDGDHKVLHIDIVLSNLVQYELQIVREEYTISFYFLMHPSHITIVAINVRCRTTGQYTLPIRL